MNDLQVLIDKAIVLRGSQAKLATAAGCSQQYISLLRKGKTGLSAEMALAFERATDGQLSRHLLRPDVFGPAPVEERAQ